MFKKVDRQAVRKRKQLSIRNKISGTAERPRLSVYRSNSNIFAQIIDDVNGVTLVSASTIDKELKATVANGGNLEAAKMVGKAIAERAAAKGITTGDILTISFQLGILPINLERSTFSLIDLQTRIAPIKKYNK